MHSFLLHFFSFIGRRLGLYAGSLAFFLPIYQAVAQSGVIPVNLPVTLTAEVVPGQTTVTLPFALAGADRLRLDVIVPVNGSALSLLDPTGAEVLGPNGPAVQFTPGEVSQPGSGLPGGVYVIEAIQAPRDGEWRVVVSYPPASGKTVIVATVLAKSRYEVGFALTRTSYITGEDIALGIAVFDSGQPIAGLAPSLLVQRADGTGGTLQLLGKDDGMGPDGLEKDGIYSVDLTLATPGIYNLAATVNIPTPTGSIRRVIDTRIEILNPTATIHELSITRGVGTAGCLAALNLALDTEFFVAGDYAFAATLRGHNGQEYTARSFLEGVGVERQTVSLTFEAGQIDALIGVDGPYTVHDIRVFRVVDDFDLQFQWKDVVQTPMVSLSEICRPAVFVDNTLEVAQRLNEGMIDQLSFSFPVVVARAGRYTVTFKVVAAQGEDIIQIGESRDLVLGRNRLTFSVASDKFLKLDGPYAVVSVLVLGPGGSAQSSRVGASGPLSRWQFFPRLKGDLNDDGVLDSADQSILASFRNAVALVPGDRRDLNRDGKINILDTRELVNLIALRGGR